MHQRAEDPRDREDRVSTPHDQEGHVAAVTPEATRTRPDEEPTRSDMTVAERRPTIEPTESNPNVTPIRTPLEQSRPPKDADAEARVGVETRAPEHDALFPSDEVDRYRADWQLVQATFVDDPKSAMHQADELVSRTIARLSDVFGEERRKLQPGSAEDGNVSTEDLRLGLQRYRAFFDRLLSL